MNQEIFTVGNKRFKTVLHFCDGDKTYGEICKECQNEKLIKQFIVDDVKLGAHIL